MNGYYVHTKQEAFDLVFELMKSDSSVGWGGSDTINSLGIKEELYKRDFKVIDRDKAKDADEKYNIERYEKEFLFADYEADATICSMKQTTYLACMIGSLMVNLFTNFIANSLNPIIPYDLPFFTEYDAQNMLFKTES